MKDAVQKEMVFKHFTSQGWYTLCEVPVYLKGGAVEEKKVITDIDILGFRPSTDLSWDLVMADCKTFKGQSPANRVLWLSGLMKKMNASSGMIILQRKKGQHIEPDHKLLASKLGITMLDENEFSVYDKAMCYPEGSSKVAITPSHVIELRSVAKRYPELSALVDYVFGRAWNEQGHFEIIRKLIGETKIISGEINPENKHHLALVLESAAALSVAISTCVGVVFSQYLHPEREGDLDHALKIIIWGGKEQYEYISGVRKKMMTAKGATLQQAEEPLALPAWDCFIQLIRNMLENPKLVFSVPHVLRTASHSVLSENPFLSELDNEDLLLIKYGMATVDYFCKATKLPVDVNKKLIDCFVKKQSEIIHKEEVLPVVDKVTMQITRKTEMTENEQPEEKHVAQEELFKK